MFGTKRENLALVSVYIAYMGASLLLFQPIFCLASNRVSKIRETCKKNISYWTVGCVLLARTKKSSYRKRSLSAQKRDKLSQQIFLSLRLVLLKCNKKLERYESSRSPA